MKRFCLLLTTAASLSQGLAQNVTSTDLYTLADNEFLTFQNEHQLHLKNGKTGYLMFIGSKSATDTSYYAVLNGKKIGPYDKMYGPEVDKWFVNDGIYWYTYQKDGKDYMHFNGEDFGPYDAIGPKGGWHHPIIKSAEEYAFTYMKGEKQYIVVNGKSYGPYDDVHDGYTTYNRDIVLYDDGGFSFRYVNDGQEYVNINNKVHGPFGKIGRYRGRYNASNPEQVSFSYEKVKGQKYTFANGVVNGPFEDVGVIGFSKNNQANYWAINQGKYYVITNGKKMGPFQAVKSFRYDDGLLFLSEGEGGKYVHHNSETFGPYDEVYKTEMVNGKVYFIYKKDGFKYVMADGEKLGPYHDVDKYSLKIRASGAYGFAYVSGLDHHVYVNGKAKPVDGKVKRLVLGDNGSFLYSYERKADKKTMVVSPSKTYGPYNSADLRWNGVADKNKWYFTAIDDNGKYLVTPEKTQDKVENMYIVAFDKEHFKYRYKSGEDWYAVIDGNTFGPYQNVYVSSQDELNSFDYRKGDLLYKYIDGNTIITRPAKECCWQTLVSSDNKHAFNINYRTKEIYLGDKKSDIDMEKAFGFSYNEVTQSYHWLEIEGRTLVMKTMKP